MAYSTQRIFFHVPFMNEKLEFLEDDCDECVKLKSYPSTMDDRSWAAGEIKPSRFVFDLVACNFPIISNSKGDNVDSRRDSSLPEGERNVDQEQINSPRQQSQNKARGTSGGSLGPDGKRGESQSQDQGAYKKDPSNRRVYWHPNQSRQSKNRSSYEDLLHIREH